MNEFSQIDGISGVWSRTTQIFPDARGYFFEELRKSSLPAGVPDFVQDSISHSNRNVLRGMHLQEDQWQLITLLSGQILDVVFNLDEKSSEYKKSSSISLSWDGMNQILIRPGIAHGYAVLSESAMIHYKSSIYYGDSDQIGVHWQSNEVVHHWPDQNWQLSERDSGFQMLRGMV
jgi:dTDP-4-dehydrorhamnose 3,5-epimerase